jgi:aminoglycoside phosphotransferase (APT) family kinase protein
MKSTLSASDVGAYLVEHGIFPSPEGLDVVELTGGISSTVLAVRGQRKRVVVKQALARFRVEDEWLVPQDRVVAEAQALELMASLAPGSVPRVLDLDRDTFALVMEEAPAGWQPWKALLLEGTADLGVATRLGELLSVLHSADADIGSAESFHAQRVDPYLRTVQRRLPALAAQIETYVERLVATSQCVVHGDYSPKNVLVGGDGLWVIDWEIVHRGDPAFDLAFLLNHLLLKTIHRPQAREGYEACGLAFVGAYGRPVDLTYALGLVGCLMLARVDGKSPAEYLTEPERERARAAGIALLTDPPSSLEEAWSGLRR